MKKYILGAAALLALAAPGVASAQSGYVGLSYSQNSDTEFDTISLNGSVAVGSNFQLDGGYAQLENDFGVDGDFYNVGGHFFSRGANWLWGGYAGYNSFEAGGDSLDEWIGAGQVQYYADRTTFSGDLSYSQSDFIGVDVDQWALDGEARYFVSDNLSLQGNIGYFDASVDGGGSLDGTNYGLGAEWQFASAPISIYGGWQQVDLDGSDSSSLGIGARWNFGGTLFERNRSGAGLGRPSGFLERLLVAQVTPR